MIKIRSKIFLFIFFSLAIHADIKLSSPIVDLNSTNQRTIEFKIRNAELKEDELSFMDFDKNYYYFVEENVVSNKSYPFKVFSAQVLDHKGLEIISINKVNDQETAIYEYGCEVDLSVDFNDSEIFFCRNFT